MSSAQTAIALIEDSDDDYELFRRVVTPCADLRRWPTAEAALAELEHDSELLRSLDGLIVDIDLPGMDGIEFVGRVRALPHGTTPPICMLTGREQQGARERAREAGADGFLLKPDTLAGLRSLPEQLKQLTR